MSRIRVMTYNIHGGRGTDGKIDLARIIDVLAPFDADIVALQEVDVHHARSGDVDQAAAIGERLGLAATFIPTIESYGLATLTRLPILDTRKLCLPRRERLRSEPRCALVLRLDWHGTPIDMVNTHLSVRFTERRGQVEALLGALEDRDQIIAGDFNCTPWSRPFRMLRGDRTCAASPRSWPSVLPVVPLDHIVFRGRLRVVRSGIWRAGDIRHASDHLPVFAELEAIAEERAA